MSSKDQTRAKDTEEQTKTLIQDKINKTPTLSKLNKQTRQKTKETNGQLTKSQLLFLQLFLPYASIKLQRPLKSSRSQRDHYSPNEAMQDEEKRLSRDSLSQRVTEGCTGCGVQQSACQGFQQGCPGFQGCTGCGVQQGAWLGSACSGQGCGQGMPCVSGQGQSQVGLERQGLTGCRGPNVGGITPQNERMQEILRMTQGLDPMQVLRLRQVLGEQVNQVRGVPELFGQRHGMFPNGYNPMHVGTSGDSTLDVFARSEKWIGNPPTPETAKWSNRELEILGWSTYIGDLVAWSMQASLEFGSEIEQACRWPTALQWQELSSAQRARSRRLMAILKAAFNGHPRTVTLINAYSEAVNLLSSEVGVNPDLQSSNGFELIRQLTMEYSLRTRSEALSFRTALAHKSFSLHASETSPSTVVTDTIRKD